MSSPPAGPTISVRPDAVAALAAELATLAGELADDAAACRSAATSLHTAFPGEEGWATASAATAWAALTEAVAARTGAVADTVLAALSAYRTVDTAIASRIVDDATSGQAGER